MTRMDRVVSVVGHFSAGAAAAALLTSVAGAGAPPPRCDPGWSPGFEGEAGVDQVVDAFAIFDDGQGGGPALFVGGQFSMAGGIEASGVARWDGKTWNPLGSGVAFGPFNGFVSALAVFDDGTGPALYAGGGFTTAGGVEAVSIARWDGASWSPLGSGILQDEVTPGAVLALAVFDDGTGPALYAGGTFEFAGGVPAKSLARWDGTTWSALPSQLDDKFPGVYALTVFDAGLGGGPRLFVGGSFSGAGGLATGSVAMWNGASWSKPGLGIAGEVYAMTVADLGGGPALYAGGFFPVPGFGLSKHVARWNGTAWAPLGSGTGSAVYALSAFDDGVGTGPVLCAGGFFETAGGQSALRIARWDGAAWSPFGTGLGVASQSTEALIPFDDDGDGLPALYAGGQFTTAGGLDSNHIARWGCAIKEPCAPADLSCDGVVDGTDLGLMLAAWGPCSRSGACPADLDGDGQVSGSDLGVLLAAWSI